MLNKAGFRFQKVPIYHSLYLTKMPNAPPSGSPLVGTYNLSNGGQKPELTEPLHTAAASEILIHQSGFSSRKMVYVQDTYITPTLCYQATI